MKKVKRLIAMAAASMLLCGFVCQAAAGSSEKEGEPEHFHHYYLVSSTCTGSTNVSQHSYVSGIIHKPSGDVNTYATCTVVRFYYSDLYRCSCLDEIKDSHSEEKHMNCGQ